MRRFLLLALILSACPKGAFRDYLPQVSFDKVDFDRPTWQGVDADFVLRVRNPNPIGVDLDAWRWALELRDQAFLSGDAPGGGTLPPRGETPFSVPVRFDFRDIVETVRANRGQAEVPYTFSGALSVQTPLGLATVPFRHRGEIPPLRPPKIQLQTLRVERIDLVRGQVELALDLAAMSEGGGAMGLDSFAYTLGLGGREIVSGSVPRLGTLQNGESLPLSIPIRVGVVQIGSSVLSSLQQKEPLQARLKADLSVDTALGSIPLSVDEQTRIPVR
ncbi:MAG: hypothetical protein EA397_05320 [Deltaproteobacteria bacterium]|nr:MAG: hypothetical protein EA397_05320 [Deltaproteobacteria bacterium]